MVAHGTPCLGPVTHAGCGAICPAYDRGCYGCFGPMETPNTASLTRRLQRARHGRPRASSASSARSTPTRRRSRRRATRWLRRTKTIRTDDLARVEGEGAMLVRDRATARVERRRAAASTSRRASSRRFLRGRAFTEAPDITARICGICPVAYQMSAVHGDGGRLRRRGRRPAPGAAPAPLLRRVDREPRAARLHAPRAGLPRLRRARSSWRATTATLVERGARAEEDRQRADDGRRRPRDPPGQRAGRRLLPRAAQARAARRSSRRSSARARSRSRRSAGPPGFDFPDFEQDYELVALAEPGEYPIERGRIVSNRGLDIARRRSTTSTSSRSTSSARTRCTRALSERRRLPRRPARALRARRPTGSRRSRARRRGRPASSRRAQPVPQHRRALASSSSTRATRRCA